MGRMFPLLGSLLGSTQRRRGGGGAQVSFDFTAMSSPQLLAAGWSITRDNAIWVPDSAGDYAEIASGALAKSDLGVMCFGGFTNIWRNPVWSGGTTGTPGAEPTNNAVINTPTINATEIGTYKGLPLWEVAYTSQNVTIVTFGIMHSDETALNGDSYHATVFGSAVETMGLVVGYYGKGITESLFTATLTRVLSAVTMTDAGTSLNGVHGNLNGLGTNALQLAGPQIVKNIGLHPNVLALSSAATTVTASQIPVLSRVTPGECSFVLPVVTSPGRKGTDDVIASASLDANNQLLVVHEEADNNILLRLVTSGTTVGEVDLGVVGDNVYTVISGSVSTGRLAGALEGMEDMLEITGSGIIPPPAFTRWTLGNDHAQAAGTQFWGSVLGLRIN